MGCRGASRSSQDTAIECDMLPTVGREGIRGDGSNQESIRQLSQEKLEQTSLQKAVHAGVEMQASC